MPAALAVAIPALEAAATLPACMAALAPGVAGGLIGEILVADGGSQDATAALAAAAGARVIAAPRGRGPQLAAAAAASEAPWLLFLHADTRLSAGWDVAVAAFIAVEEAATAPRAAAFRLRLDDPSAAARRLERLVAWRCRRLALPYGDQGLLIARRHYEALGGFPPIPLMEDVALVRRVGRRRLVMLPVEAVTSAARYRSEGYLRRPLRNLGLLALFLLGVSPAWLARRYAPARQRR